ncbi:MAG: DNA-processing protein DprA [Clostridia bacterium]|nr:DNA-processing protein DprA [Clostridia bacterium]
MSDVRYWLWLSLRLSPGSSAIDTVLGHFSYDAKAVFKADRKELEKVLGLKNEVIDALADKSLDETRDIFGWCMTQNVGLLAYDNPLYPERLRSIPHPPVLLYYKGKLPDFDKNVCIATVGTRKISEYGQREGYIICRDLAIAGAIVVSGMARGVDSICHRGALDAGGHTVAVLGCGINRVYPPENGPLMDEISLSGTLFTEFKPDTPPVGSNFPIRNRIISGLCQGTLVVEADDRSGALITARTAGQQGRDLFALPGKVDEQNSLGPNSLIKDGAKMVTCARDILVEYEFYYPNVIRTENLPVFLPRFVNGIHQREQVLKATKVLITKAANDAWAEEEKKNGKTAAPKKKSKIKKKASTMVEEPEIEELPFTAEEPKEQSAPEEIEVPKFIGKIQADILKLMPLDRPVSADDLAKQGQEVSTVLSAMTMLEVGGLVRCLPGGLYQRIK